MIFLVGQNPDTKYCIFTQKRRYVSAHIIYLWHPTEKRLAENAFKTSHFQEEKCILQPYPLLPYLVYELGHQPLWHASCLRENELHYFSKHFLIVIDSGFLHGSAKLNSSPDIPIQIWSKEDFISRCYQVTLRCYTLKKKDWNNNNSENCVNCFTLLIKLNIHFQLNNFISLQEIYST